MQSPAIVVDHVTKQFRLRGQGRTLKAAVLDAIRPGRRQERSFPALKEVSFEVRRGETLGIIGCNGAGKSTLLGLIAGTLAPTAGTIHTSGTLSSLLELGAGFHPDLSGRENVFLYGAIMGIPRRQMKARFDAIMEFADIGPFIDQPVKHYSSGMYVRLGFAVAVEVDPDILLVDEVLAVGDAAFQRKCLAKMRAFRQAGKTLLIISHDHATIRSVSDRILFLDHGQVRGLGHPDEMVSAYERFDLGRRVDRGMRREWGTGEIRLTAVAVVDHDGNPVEAVSAGSTVTVRIGYAAEHPIENPVFGFAIADDQGRIIHGSNTQLAGFELPSVSGEGRLLLELPNLRLATGAYLLSFSIHSADHRTNYHRLDHAVPVIVSNCRTFDGCVDLPSHWRRP